MIHYSKVINGAMRYIDDEIISKMNGSMKGWGVGIAAGLMAKRAEQIYARLRDVPALAALGLVDGEMVDAEGIYAEALRMAQKGSATINIPIIGAVTFTAADVESLYRHIIGG